VTAGERSFKASHKIKWSPEQELKTSKDNVHKSKKPEVEESFSLEESPEVGIPP
jgi:hypothetical protein